MNIILFRYSPYAVMINYANEHNSIIIAPSAVRKKYEDFCLVGYNIPKIIYIEDYVLPEIIRALRDIQKEYDISNIVTLSEEDMEWVGLVSDFFMEKKSTFVSNTLFKDKYYMRSFLIDIVNQPYFRLIESEDDIWKFWEKVEGNNAIIKTRFGAGAEKIFKYSKNDKNLSEEIFSGNYMIEEVVEFPNMLTCDGYSFGSSVKRFFSHVYPEELLLDSLQEGGSGECIIRTSPMYSTNIKFLKEIFRQCKKVLEIFAVQGEITPFHFEWFYNRKNELVFCEVGKRFGGGSIPFLIQYSFGINILKEYWDQLEKGENKTIPCVSEEQLIFPKKISTTYAPYKRRGRVTQCPSEKEYEWAEKSWIYVHKGAICETPQSIVENAFIVVFVSLTEEEYCRKMCRAKELAKSIVYEEISDMYY